MNMEIGIYHTDGKFAGGQKIDEIEDGEFITKIDSGGVWFYFYFSSEEVIVAARFDNVMPKEAQRYQRCVAIAKTTNNDLRRIFDRFIDEFKNLINQLGWERKESTGRSSSSSLPDKTDVVGQIVGYLSKDQSPVFEGLKTKYPTTEDRREMVELAENIRSEAIRLVDCVMYSSNKAFKNCVWITSRDVKKEKIDTVYYYRFYNKLVDRNPNISRDELISALKSEAKEAKIDELKQAIKNYDGITVQKFFNQGEREFINTLKKLSEPDLEEFFKKFNHIANILYRKNKEEVEELAEKGNLKTHMENLERLTKRRRGAASSPPVRTIEKPRRETSSPTPPPGGINGMSKSRKPPIIPIIALIILLAGVSLVALIEFTTTDYISLDMDVENSVEPGKKLPIEWEVENKGYTPIDVSTKVSWKYNNGEYELINMSDTMSDTHLGKKGNRTFDHNWTSASHRNDTHFLKIRVCAKAINESENINEDVCKEQKVLYESTESKNSISEDLLGFLP